MIRARFFCDDEKMYGFEISGHAGYADKGKDIVCASVSSAVQMTANTITDIIGEKADVKAAGDNISLRLNMSGETNDSVQAVMKGLHLHLSILSDQFEGTIRVEDSEV